MKNCINCSAPLNSGWSFCDSCGILINQGYEKIIECENHARTAAIGFCVICSQPVCSNCMIKIDEKIICTNAEHRELINDWEVIYRPTSEFEADAIFCNLNAGGIQTKFFSLHDHISAYGLKEKRILVFVKRSEFEKAKSLLLDLNLIENI